MVLIISLPFEIALQWFTNQYRISITAILLSSLKLSTVFMNSSLIHDNMLLISGGVLLSCISLLFLPSKPALHANLANLIRQNLINQYRNIFSILYTIIKDYNLILFLTSFAIYNASILHWSLNIGDNNINIQQIMIEIFMSIILSFSCDIIFNQSKYMIRIFYVTFSSIIFLHYATGFELFNNFDLILNICQITMMPLIYDLISDLIYPYSIGGLLIFFATYIVHMLLNQNINNIDNNIITMLLLVSIILSSIGTIKSKFDILYKAKEKYIYDRLSYIDDDIDSDFTNDSDNDYGSIKKAKYTKKRFIIIIVTN